ncbi:hypothetical protein C8D77_13114 [Mesorhizobium loti]|uniref:Uncharacterized protein n=1 Tax=Rhizobium loti TaxID=381 RepID=A0A8E2W5D0_RHILI|nr:hypothetical protein C8D77_13114 [Mesorhizobium loti]
MPESFRGDDGRGDLVQSPEPPAKLGKVVKQMRRLALLTPSCGGQSADREEKRVTCGTVQKKMQEQLDLNDPNQRGLLETAGYMIDSSLATSANASTARLMSAMECAADICVRMRAWPFGTTGKEKPIT